MKNMVTVNNFDARSLFYEYFEFLNGKYLGNEWFLIDNNLKGNGNSKSKKFKLPFANDPIYKFLTDFHFVEPEDIVSVNEKNVSSNQIIVPNLKESYLKFDVKNYCISSDQNKTQIVDPFYLMWIEQVQGYFNDLNELATTYFERNNDIRYIHENSVPYKLFIHMNEKITKLKRRAKIIETLVNLNSSVVTLNKGKKGEYYAIRCNKIDDYGDIDRDTLIKINPVIGEVIVPEKSNVKRNRKYEGTSSKNYKPEIFADELFAILKPYFRSDFTTTSDPLNNTVVKRYFIYIDNNKVELDFSAEHLTLIKVLSILEFGELHKEFKEIYK